MNTKSNLLKSIFISLILLMGVSNAWGATVTLRYQANMPSGNYDASSSQTMTVSSIDGNRYYCELSLSANTSYGFFIKKDNNYYKVNTNASSSKSVQLYDYGSSNYGNSNHRVTYKTGSSGKYIFTFDASNNKIVVSPQSETVELVYDKANGHDTWWDLDNKKAMTQDGSNYYCDVDLSKEKYYMFIRINNTIFWRGTSALPHALYYYGDTNLGNSGDKMNYTPTATSKHRFIWNHLDKTLSIKPFYTVTFDANGHGTAPGAQTILSGTKATEPTAPTATGYTFGGWYKESGCTNKYNFNTAVTDNLTLYAKWTLSEQQYTVTAVASPAEGGKVTPTTATLMGQNTGDDITATANTGYTFNNWSIKSGSGSFTDAKAASTTFKPTAVSTVQANFTANKYTVKFHENGGKGEMADQDFIYGETQNLTENAFTLENALFVGWATSEENAKNGVVAYINGQSVSNLTTTKDGVVNLYAVWATIEITSHPERIKTTGPLELNITYTNIPANYYYRVMIDGTNPCPDKNHTEWISISGSGSSIKYESYETYNFVSGVRSVTVEVYNNSKQKLFHSIQKTFIAEQINNIAVYYNTGNGNMLYKDITGVSETFGATVSAQDIITEKGIVGYKFTNWSIISGTIEFDPNINSETVTITATTGGQIIAHFEELQPKTIYLKTIEGTTDGVTWHIKYNGTEYPMDELGCTNEYYKGVVPEGTSFQFVSRDASTNIVETKGTNLQYVEGKTLYNLVSAAASGNKIFFKPNSNWKNDGTHKYFVARFWAGSAVIKDLIDNDGDGIYECEKPAGATEVYFCLTKAQASASSGKDWPSDEKAHTHNNVKTGFKDGKNLFTLGDDQEVGGENDTGTWSTHADTPVNGEGEWTIFEGATYRITFNHEGAANGTTTPGVAYVDAQHNSAMPTIESLPKNTNWKFGGYYTDGGTAITNAFGDWLDVNGYISNGKWVGEECVELYAHWVEKTPEITNVELSNNVFDVGSVETVIATPTVQEYPSYTGDYTICWKMLDNSGTVMDLFPFTPVDPGDNNSVSFSVDGLTSGTYTVRASIYASACDTGEELSRFDAKITIVSGYKVTVKYLCGDNVIQASDIYPGHASTPVEIKAPEIGGYKFVNWELGDGIFSESDLKSETIEYTAIYDGYLTAKYEKRKLIFLDLSTLPNKEKWTEPHIYLYSGKYWDENKGTGATTNCVKKEAMTKVPNTENIWYYDYESVNNFNGIVAFTSTNKMSQGNFWDCEVIFREDFSSGTPVFVPASDQEAEIKNNNNSKNAAYYSKGYWVKYMDGTGYWMIIYNEAGDKELVRREFTSETQRMTMTSIVDLEAEHTYQYEIYRNDGYYYKGGDITYTNSSTYRPLNEANKHTIKTTETGDYTFTLDYFTGDLQIKVQYPGEVGDYRILYTDDVRKGRYKPSQIISQNNKEPLVSFFVRPNDNPVLKIQKATLVTETEVKWDNKVLYLTPNGNWKADGARFAAAFMNSDKSRTEWVSMTSIKKGEYYGCAIPAGTWKYVIFCRMNGSTTDNNWDNKWDQTNDLTIPTNGNNQYTVAAGAWSNGSGTWSKHNNDIIDLSEALKVKLGELNLTNIKDKEGTVFNIHLSNTNGTPTIEKVALYTGNYYIRVDAVDGKWYDYKTNPDNLMTYSAFSESDENSFGEKFSHYKTKWCEQGMNVKFVIANDYSLCISDTLTQDENNPFGNIDAHGDINKDGKYNANIRFMWNRHTNKVSRAYVAAASDEARKFLVLKANKTIQNESGQAINNNEIVFKDTQNWLYERTIKVQPGTLVKLYACYPDLDEAKAQHFRGKYSNDFTQDVTAVQILGGNSEEWYTMRIIYDFKTNRLMGAWIPDQNINGTLEIDADIMVIRQHQEDATYITFAKNGGQLTEVKTVYGVMRFNRWTLNNRSTTTHDVLPVQNQKSIYERALYFISFPFDVHLSDVFGFGTYGTHWVISEYNGLRRAKNGYFVDNCINEDCTNWDYIWDPSNFTMKANQGYLLSLDLDLMKHDNTSFWEHDIQQVELFFPSFAHVETIKQTSYTMPALSGDYECKINFNNANPGETGYNPANDHRVRDSYWRCIGVPSFADYNNTLTTDGTNKITWQPKGSEFPFLYEWNVSDNSLMVRAATNYKFRSTFAYLVQNGNPIYWSAVNTKPSNIVARSQEAKRNYEWKITIARNGEVEDQTFVRLTDHEKVTTEFDFNQDLSKEFNYGRSDIYTLIGYEKAAANSLPLNEQTTLIPLGLSIEYNGDYTIAMPDGTANIGVTLIDTESNTRTNLSAGMEYTLTLNKGDYNNRFFIEISPIQQTPTDIEYVTGDSSNQNSVRKVLIDNILYIVRDGQIFDARGARVK